MKSLLFLGMMSLASGLQAQQERPGVMAAEGKATPLQNRACEFRDLKLPADYQVYAAGAYSGRPIGFQIDQSGHEATQIDVEVNNPAKPVVLMLGAYEPTIWNISWSERTQIVAVLASGYHRQESLVWPSKRLRLLVHTTIKDRVAISTLAPITLAH